MCKVTWNQVTSLSKGIRKELSKLNTSKSAGPDGYHPRILKKIQDEIVKPLKMMFEKSLDVGYLPEDLWEANFTSMFKKFKNPRLPTTDM